MNLLLTVATEDPRLKLRINFGVSYRSDVFHVRDVALQVAVRIGEEFSEVLREPEPAVGFLDYGESSLDFVLLIWIINPHNEMKIKSSTRFMLFKAFQEEGIEIPFPQRDLHIRSMDSKVAETLYCQWPLEKKGQENKKKN